jgi:aminoglycoside phosphotransferase (APT) family kinase protein
MAIKGAIKGVNGAVPSAVRWGRVLHARGVRTPDPIWLPTRRALAAPWIDGETGRDVLAREWMPALAGRDRALRDALGGALRTLAALHGTPPAGLDVDPLVRRRHVDRRLDACKDERVCAAARAILQRTDPDPADPGPTRGLVHGDCHLGQFVFPAGGSDPWIVDLDDLAIGPPEHDAGNLIAHLTTCVPRRIGADSLLPARSWILEAAEGAVGAPLSPQVVDDHIAVALVRRALKLRERDPDVDARTILELARALV